MLAGKISNPEQIANIRRQLGIDEPLYVQLWIFLKQTVCFDFGNSWSTGESVSGIILSRLGPSLTLLVPLTILETGLAIALGLAVAYVRGSLTDRMIMIVCTVGMSVSILVYIDRFPVLAGVQARMVPGARLGARLAGESVPVCFPSDTDFAGCRHCAQSSPLPDIHA